LLNRIDGNPAMSVFKTLFAEFLIASRRTPEHDIGTGIAKVEFVP
jgi:hypothetical protein